MTPVCCARDELTGKLRVDFAGSLERQMIKNKLQKHKAAESAESDEAEA